MTNPKEISELSVFHCGHPVASLSRSRDGSIFRYSDEYVASRGEPIARNLPILESGIEVRGTANLHSFFAGLLPEGIMQDAIVRQHRLSRDDLFSQLAISGSDAIGDVTVLPTGSTKPPGVKTSREAVQLLIALRDTGTLRATPSLSGAQPKLSIGAAVASQRGVVAIVKIAPVQFPGIVENEAFVMNLATRAGLRAAKVRIEGEGLVIERFDRIKQKGGPPHQIHVEDSLQILDRYPLAKYSLDYVEIMDAAVELGVAKATLLDLLRLYAFSYLVLNGDLHAKNVSFIYDRGSGKWTMSPAYDLVCTYPYFADTDYGLRMALGLDEQFGAFTSGDFRAIGQRYGLPDNAVDSMLRGISLKVRSAGLDCESNLGSSAAQEIIRRCEAVHP